MRELGENNVLEKNVDENNLELNSINYNDRIIYITTDIDEKYIFIQKFIILCNIADNNNNIPAEERIPIVIYLYTNGGEVYFTNSLVQTMLISKTPIYTVNMGITLSAGVFIFLAGSKRFSIPNALFLLHPFQLEFESLENVQISQMLSTFDTYNKIDNIFVDLITNKTNITIDKYKEYSDREWYLFSNEAKELGIVDIIIDSLDELDFIGKKKVIK